MEGSIKDGETGQHGSDEIQKCSKIPVRLYASNMTRKPILVTNGFKMNELPLNQVKMVEVGRNTSLEEIKMKNKPENENKHFKKSKLPFPEFRANVYEYWIEYSNNSSIQGIKYMGEKTRPVFERLAWLIFFCISLYFCTNLIIQTYAKWENSPVLLSFARSPTPVWKIPFPAVTICSEIKTRTNKYNFTKSYHKVLDKPKTITVDEYNYFCGLALVCDTNVYPYGNLTTEIDIIELVLGLAPQRDDVLWLCQYPAYNLEFTCGQLFTPILTEEGLCFTFNMLDRSQIFRSNVFMFSDFIPKSTVSNGWTLETGYPIDDPIRTYPRRALSVGFQSRFIIMVRALEQDLDYVCKGPVQGFKILLHNPAETPKIGTQFFRAPHRQEVILAVKPEMITTSNSLKNYDPHRRQCYFSDERYLAFFQSYTQQSCELECLANFTKAKCGCVSHHMPHEKGTPICATGSTRCVINARNELVIKEVQSGIDNEESDANNPTGCDCLPGCTSLIYNTETSQAEFNWDKMDKSLRDNLTSQPDGLIITRINIFFKEQQFITAERNELYGHTDFLASCGGLLGLFTGFSFLSLVEIIYFLSLRLLCNLKQYGRHNWSGSQELVKNV